MSDVPELTRCWEHLSIVSRGQTDGDVYYTAGCLFCELDVIPKCEPDEVTPVAEYPEKPSSAFASCYRQSDRTDLTNIGFLDREIMVAVVVVNDGSLYRAGFAGDEGPRAVFLPITDRSKKPSIEVKIATDVDASEFSAAKERSTTLTSTVRRGWR